MIWGQPSEMTPLKDVTKVEAKSPMVEANQQSNHTVNLKLKILFDKSRTAQKQIKKNKALAN
jgi:hypothetical protein